jgi:hypothetical protein
MPIGRHASHESDLDGFPQALEGPAAKTADERVEEERQRRARRRARVLVPLLLLLAVASHTVTLIPGVGFWVAVAVWLAYFSYGTWSFVRHGGPRAARRGYAAGGGVTGSPLRLVVLIWLAISVAMVVLVSLDNFFRWDNLLLLAVVWAILAVLWLADRGLVRLASSRRSVRGHS